MRTVFLGDSHLARVQRDIRVVGPDIRNAAEGGATSLDLVAQAAAVEDGDIVVVSVGTNDAAPWRHVPVAAFARALLSCLGSVPARRWIYVTPPGVDESRLNCAGDRTNAVVDDYRAAAISAFTNAGARVVHADELIRPLGPEAFASDGLHLSGPAYKVVLPAIAEAVRGTD